MTLNMGYLYPFFVQEVLPGDRFRVACQIFLRFLSLISPVMHRVDVYTHFFVPNRLVWANWYSFVTGGESGTSGPVMPQFSLNNVTAGIGTNALRTGSLLDHLGFPVMKGTDTYQGGLYGTNQYNALIPRAYQLIYDQYYRDQNVETTNLTATFNSDGLMSVADTTVALTLRQRAWEKDLLTSALPFTQRGNAVTLPINVTAPTTGIGGNQPFFRNSSTGAAQGASINVNATGSNVPVNAATTTGATSVYYDPNGSLSANNLTVNALRLSVKLQEWLEINARGGGRYIETIWSNFGVLSSDARLQRAEYKGGGKSPVTISEVLQTSTPSTATGGNTPLATMSGHGMSLSNVHGFTGFFEEHGVVIGILSVLPRTSYQQLMGKEWTRYVNTDYYIPSFANLGEQAVLNQEAYTSWSDNGYGPSAMLSTFGYTARYAEYKYKFTQSTGQMRDTLSYWNFDRQFPSLPALNTAFVHATVRTDPFAVSGLADNLLAQILLKIDAIRPMPYYAIPNI
ncbi:major capsid protein VP1 [Microviridae Bog1249_12]|uniref:major capsid protein VP1 n=1 Tax=Microviridae Bog1249_12 TaxID=1655647 RepID=UPI00063D55F3|nr:major capsid protein VP1 [Microviridae Bog1249_12]AKI26871.1 major capsid protein VP1 [Microviridae Bog1249_12]